MGILILIYLCVSLVGIFTFKTASEQAKATINELTSASSGLSEGQTKNFLIQSPKDWWFIEFNQTFCLCTEDHSCSYQQGKLLNCGSCVCQATENKILLLEITNKKTLNRDGCGYEGSPSSFTYDDCFQLTDLPISTKLVSLKK
jgi:hypothetical protein